MNESHIKYEAKLKEFRDLKTKPTFAKKISESIFDILYKLEKQERTDEEDYLLAKIYIELGHRWEAYKFIESKIEFCNERDKVRYEKLLGRITDLFKFNNAKYEDSRNHIDNLYRVTNSKEAIFDNKYKLEKRDRTNKDDYLLARTYIDLGLRWKAQKFIESKIEISNSDDKFKYEKLIKFVNYLFEYDNIEYKDLRESKIRKSSIKLNYENLIINNNSVRFKENQQIIILNKKINKEELSEELDFSYHSSFSINQFIQILDEYFIWINSCASELIDYYNSNFSLIEVDFGDLPCKRVDLNWFDGLSIDYITLDLDEKGNLLGHYTIYDYYNFNTGFLMKTFNKSIISIEYNPDL